jgi:hypothetical protein
LPPIQPISDSVISTTTRNGLISTIPQEILTQILAHILVNDNQEPITLHSRSSRRWKNELLDLKDRRRYYDSHENRYYVLHKANKSKLLNILLVSRSFYFASIAAFYGENVLQFENAQHLDRLTATLDLDRRRCIRHIAFQPYWYSQWRERWDVPAVGERLGVCFERLPSLLRARLVCQTAYFYGVSKVREVFETLKDGAGERGEILTLDIKNRDGLEWGDL